MFKNFRALQLSSGNRKGLCLIEGSLHMKRATKYGTLSETQDSNLKYENGKHSQQSSSLRMGRKIIDTNMNDFQK